MDTSHSGSGVAANAAAVTSAQKPLYPRTTVAGPLHTVVVLLILGTWAYFGRIMAAHMRAEILPNRMYFYLRTFVTEWVVFFFVLYGVWRHGTSTQDLLGPRWKKAGQLFRDLGIACVFELISLIVLGVVAHLLHAGTATADVGFMMPANAAEICMWVALSVTAGICEETIFRGYLLRQFSGWARSATVGVIVSSLMFGACHIYQGTKHAIVIAIYGSLFAMLAVLRRSTKPGMIAHGLQDGGAGILYFIATRLKLPGM